MSEMPTPSPLNCSNFKRGLCQRPRTKPADDNGMNNTNRSLDCKSVINVIHDTLLNPQLQT